MSDAEWARVRELLPVPARMAGRGGRPEGYCHRQMIDAVRYLVANGIKWRAMPADFPPWPRVYAFFARWRDLGVVAELHERLREAVRRSQGRRGEPSAGVVDSQSVKADTTVTRLSRGFDVGKKINGRKRHLLTDTLGLLLGVLVTPASTTDRDAARILLPAAKSRFRGLAQLPASTAPATPATSRPTTDQDSRDNCDLMPDQQRLHTRSGRERPLRLVGSGVRGQDRECGTA
ncbi:MULTISPECIES: IS5 family transposase [Streptomyces]|uniref:IS5 family transposase n=1 Tax=Streptomyces xinghaiensis TaxID=1038928 RepID=A0A3R7ELN5_9ACTN|nr:MULTISPECIES: IS5 family transposase [Streptomyces]PQM23850.1 hypothetical protein Sfr7A_09655 [Streptomyces xinghaiensis]RKM92039.1 IS5 family transposase [Streptomyces xinghaiensis]RNC73542.1 IS5 family transposase [Streptomyces xinghaiensis]